MQQKYIDIDGLKYLVGRLKSQMDIYLGKKYNSEDVVTATNKLQTRFITLTDSEGNTDKVLFNGTADVEFTKPLSTVYIKELFGNLLDNKVDVVEGYTLSSNEFTDEFKTKLENLAHEANKYIHPETHVASVLIQDENNRLVTDVEKAVFSDKYTKEEFDSEMNLAVENISWLPAVEAYSDILVKYPNPVDGNVVNVNDTDITYRYTGSEWIAISANAIPVASANDDGKMSSTDLVKLEGIEENANNYKHEETHNADIIVEDSEHRFTTDEEMTRWNDVDSKGVQDAKLSTKMDLDNFVDNLNIETVFDDVFGKIVRVFVIETISGFDGVDVTKFLSSYSKICFNGEVVDNIPLRTAGVVEIFDAVALNTYNETNNFANAFRINYSQDGGSLATVSGYIDTSATTSMSYMFYDSANVGAIDVSSFDTSNVKDMSYMFGICENLTTLNLSNFDTRNVTTFKKMFYSCIGLVELNIATFKTPKLTDMFGMFDGCWVLNGLNLRNFDTSNVTDMSYLFTNNEVVTSLDVNYLNTSNVVSMEGMFSSNYALKHLDVSMLNIANVKNMYEFAIGCNALEDVKMPSNPGGGALNNIARAFSGCSNLKSVDLANFDTSKVTNMIRMFGYCSSLTALDLSSFNTSNVITMSNLFDYCESLKYLDLSNFDTSKLGRPYTANMFRNCYELTEVKMISPDMKIGTIQEISAAIQTFGAQFYTNYIQIQVHDASKCEGLSYDKITYIY